jgi:hypothetical protein
MSGKIAIVYGLEKYLDHVLEVEIAAIHQAHACTGL